MMKVYGCDATQVNALLGSSIPDKKGNEGKGGESEEREREREGGR